MKSSRHDKFIVAYLATRNGTKAAIAAGYSQKSAAVQASRLLRHPQVAAAIAGMRGDTLTGGNAKNPSTPGEVDVKPDSESSLDNPHKTTPSQIEQEPLTDRQERFCREYVAEGNATRAYLRVYTTSSYSAAMTDACRMLRNAQILARIQELKEERNRRLEITADRVLATLARQAFFDPRELFDADGRLKPITEIDPDTAAAITAMTTKHQVTGDEKDEVTIVTSLKFADRTRAAELLGKNLKLWTDRIEVADDASYADRLKALREKMKEERLREHK